MKIKKKSFIFVLSFIIVGALLFTIKLNLKPSGKIDKILESKSYSYLSPAAQNYIKDVYEKTGEVVHTEKNKEDNLPYLNPQYIEYLEMSDEDKEKVDLIPDPYILEYSPSESYSNSNLPSTYDLRYLNQKNYLTPMKNQGSLGICWAISSIENAETFLMLQKNQAYHDGESQIFSARQLDYASSTNGTKINVVGSSGTSIYKNSDNGSRSLADSGNFYTSSILMANGLTLVDESVLPWNESSSSLYAKDIFNYDNSKYEVNSTIQLPQITTDTASEEEINSYTNDVKNYIMQYGGAFIGTYSPDTTCGFKNSDNKYVLKTDDCVSASANAKKGHAMQLIGWDDNYEYSYCESGTSHLAATNGTCSRGTYTEGKGAWILRNSWGDDSEYNYVYLTYDSTRLSIGFITSMSEMETRNWDNNYHKNPWIDNKISNGMSNVSTQTAEFDTHNKSQEKVEKVKFLTSSKNGTYTLSITSGDRTYNNIISATVKEVGVYTFDLSDKNIILPSSKFTVKIDASGNNTFSNDSISVFTSNMNSEPSISTGYKGGIQTYSEDEDSPSETNPAIVSSYRDATLKIEHYTKNISSTDNITYRALLDGNDHSRYFFYSTPKVNNINGYIYTEVVANEEQYSDVDVCGKVYTFQVLYNGEVVESFPLKRICNNWNNNSTDYTTSKMRFHKNDGSGYVSTVSKNDTTTFKIMKNDGTGDTYIGSEKNFFLYDRYIKSWNTKADGTGITYTTNSYFVYKDMDFYAQWSDPATEKHQYNVVFECNRYICHETQILTRNIRATFNEEFTIPNNTFTNLTDGQEFIYWTFDPTKDSIYYEEEKVTNITEYGFDSPYNLEENEYLEAVWSDNYHSVSFDANGGTGNMKGIKIISDKTSRLKYNLFEKNGYTFTGWNTKADGTGTAYTDGQNVNIDSDMTLYAQWEVDNKYTITFKSNDSSNTTTSQRVPELIETKLNDNTFTRVGYTFTGWNTKADGTGTAYTDGQNVNVNSDMTLYAQWEINKYTITFNANGGTGTLDPQQVSYNTSTKLSKNTFVKDGFKFDGWNTKADGTGTAYSNQQSVSLSDNLLLYAQWIEGDPYVINEYNYDEDNSYISNIDVNTTVNEFKQNIELLGGYTVEVDFKTIDNKQVLYTGGKTKIYKNQVLYAELTNVVSGDTNGDGNISYLDYVNVYNHIQKAKHPESTKKLLVNEYLSAGDMSKDNKISYLDYVRIYNKIKELRGGTN